MTPSRLLLALVLVAGCGRPPAPPPSAAPPAPSAAAAEHVFRCPDGTEIRARYHFVNSVADSVMLQLPGGTATLPVAQSASGARYANDTLEYWEHQGTTRVAQRGRTLYQDCRPAAAAGNGAR